jgi:hypothetical protein
MLTRDDLIDIVMERLLAASGASGARTQGAPAGGAAAAAPPAPLRGRPADEPRGRRFLSEYDIRKQLTGNSQELRIPRDSIISPLAVDWLTLGRIKIVRE